MIVLIHRGSCAGRRCASTFEVGAASQDKHKSAVSGEGGNTRVLWLCVDRLCCTAEKVAFRALLLQLPVGHGQSAFADRPDRLACCPTDCHKGCRIIAQRWPQLRNLARLAQDCGILPGLIGLNKTQQQSCASWEKYVGETKDHDQACLLPKDGQE